MQSRDEGKPHLFQGETRMTAATGEENVAVLRRKVISTQRRLITSQPQKAPQGRPRTDRISHARTHPLHGWLAWLRAHL